VKARRTARQAEKTVRPEHLSPCLALIESMAVGDKMNLWDICSPRHGMSSSRHAVDTSL
jgi:hypothetical protein